MPIDIALLRNDPELVRASEIKRGRDGKTVDELLAVDEQFRNARFEWEQSNQRGNALTKQIAAAKKAGENADTLQEESRNLRATMKEVEATKLELESQRDALLHKVGNLVRPDVFTSNTEDDNVVIRTWGTVPEHRVYKANVLGFMRHDQILYRLKAFPFNPRVGTTVAGHRGYYLKGPAALLCQALVQYGWAFLNRKGYTPIQTPYFMRQEVMNKAAELKDFEESLYKIPMGGDKVDDFFLIATSEQPLCALHADEQVTETSLPIRYAGMSTCFRKEAGAAGRDQYGIFRVHQFEKIEQFVLTTADKSDEEHERMLAISEEFYQSLGLPYQVISIVSGALNDAAARKYDLEAWFPSDGKFRELVSCSNCCDYQSRALEITTDNKPDSKDRNYVHMLNGTLVAAQRTLCCLIEHWQTEAGVKVPPVLVPYVGQEFIPYPEFTKEENKLWNDLLQKIENQQVKKK